MRENKREEEVINYIKRFMEERGYAPTIREISEGVGLKSSSSGHLYFMRLVKRGEIEQIEGNARYRVKGMKYVCDM